MDSIPLEALLDLGRQPNTSRPEHLVHCGSSVSPRRTSGRHGSLAGPVLTARTSRRRGSASVVDERSTAVYQGNPWVYGDNTECGPHLQCSAIVHNDSSDLNLKVITEGMYLDKGPIANCVVH